LVISTNAIIAPALVTCPDRSANGRGRDDLRQALNLLGIDGDDVEHAVGQQHDLCPIGLADDRDVSGCRLGQALAEAASPDR
jgi:hypothetical protein